MADKKDLMQCICRHDEKAHIAPSPYACSEVCDCRHFRWTFLDWKSAYLRNLHTEKLRADFLPEAWMPEQEAS